MTFSNLSPELSVLVWVVLLLLVTIFVQVVWVDIKEGVEFTLSDRLSGLKNPTTQRLEKTVRNTVENLAMFAPIVLILAISDISTGSTVAGAWTFLIGRLIYVPSFVLHIKYLRSLSWFVGIIGIVMCAWPLVFGI